MIREGQVRGITHFERREVEVGFDIDLKKKKENDVEGEDVAGFTHFRPTSVSETDPSSICKRERETILKQGEVGSCPQF
jgi:hypothetical protein